MTQPLSTDTSDSAAPSSTSRKKRWWIIGGVGIVLIGLFLVRSGWLIAATVNGQPIARWSILRELEQTGGQQVLDRLITYALVEQAASERGLMVTDEEIARELDIIEQGLQAQGQTLDQALAIQGIPREDLESQIRVQKAVDKMVGDVTVSDEEISAFMEANKESFPEGGNEDELRQQVRQQLVQDKSGEAAQQLIDDLRARADIGYYGRYDLPEPVVPMAVPEVEPTE